MVVVQFCRLIRKKQLKVMVPIQKRHTLAVKLFMGELELAHPLALDIEKRNLARGKGSEWHTQASLEADTLAE
tara:strand:- start:730 stop:948 length:219 start_codon:yes stop_codon:yes gene_type:complete